MPRRFWISSVIALPPLMMLRVNAGIPADRMLMVVIMT
jgi:hypothetical protein